MILMSQNGILMFCMYNGDVKCIVQRIQSYFSFLHTCICLFKQQEIWSKSCCVVLEMRAELVTDCINNG